MVPVETLKTIRFLRDLPDDQLAQMASIAEQRQLPADAVLFRQGEPSSSIYLVVQGNVSLEIDVPGGGSMPFQTVGAEELLGWSPLLEVGPLTATARTRASTRLLVLNAARVRAMCEADPGFGYEFIRRVAEVLSQRLEATRQHLQ
jgi:CRP-like cAMP-binding protein